MSSALPSYSSISLRDPPKYTDVVTNRPFSPPPPYADHTGSFATRNSSQSELPPVPEEVHNIKNYIKSCSAPILILFLILLALLHLVLFGICFKCPLPKTSLDATRALFFLHIIFLVGIIICCYYKCKSRIGFTLLESLGAIFAYSMIPLGLNIFTFISITVADMTELNNVIRSPGTGTGTYPCSLSFYKLIFGLLICNYIVAPVFFIILVTILCYSMCYSNRIGIENGLPNPQV